MSAPVERVPTASTPVAGPKSPVLVTGMHRSGTSWVGSMLCAGGDLVNIGEPLNVLNRQTIFRKRVELWYAHITEANEADFLPYYRDALAFKTHPLADLARMRLGSPRDPFRIARRWGDFFLGRAQGRRLLIKDPFAVFSIDWFVRRLGCGVVVVVRHPVAVVSSLKRLGFVFDFENLLRQPSLMDERLRRFRPAIEASLESGDDVIGQGSLLWRIIYDSLEPADVRIVRHEDLSLEPVANCAQLYAELGLAFTPDARAAIQTSTSEKNPAEVPVRDPFKVRLDSRTNLGNWKRRLDQAEVERILEITGPVADRYYPEGLDALRPDARTSA
jgi:Sulfotransferase family